jgi:hypothetical protein
VKAQSVMDRVEALTVGAVRAGEMTACEATVLLEDIGDIGTVYVLSAKALHDRREARIAWERDGIDRRRVVAGEP